MILLTSDHGMLVTLKPHRTLALFSSRRYLSGIKKSAVATRTTTKPITAIDGPIAV